ncbi:uncharacterized protein LOC134199933 [Bombyx mori]|uniref:uncharacterized protein LOC134199933 n=1 Tax=Bombyx mori TaxID=7091 RepID=UPI002ED6436F
MKPNCLPSKFDCRADRKRKFTQSEPRPAFVKRQRLTIVKEIEETTKNEMCYIIMPLPSCSQDVQPLENRCSNDKAIQVAPAQEHKARQVCIATSPLNISEASTSKQSEPAKRKLLFSIDKFDSDESNAPATEGSTVDYEL